MHFFSTRKLALKIRDDRLSETEKFRYLEGVVVIQSFTIFSSLVQNGEPLLGTWSVGVLGVVFILLILFYCRELNNRFDGKNLIERFVILSFPAMVTAFLLFLVIGGILGTYFVFEIFDMNLSASYLGQVMALLIMFFR